MFKLFEFCVVLSLLRASVAAEMGKNWALLVAGSNEYYNYRHQVF